MDYTNGESIRIWRKYNGISSREMSKLCGYNSKSSINNLETGAIKRSDKLLNIARNVILQSNKDGKTLDVPDDYACRMMKQK